MATIKLDEINIHDIGDTIQIAGAVYLGKGKMLLAMFPEDHGKILLRKVTATSEEAVFLDGKDEQSQIEILNMDQEEWKKFLYQTDVMETHMISTAADGKITKSIVRKSQRQIDQAVSWAVWRRDDYHCRYCWAADVPLTVDHLVRWEEGGPSIPENLLSSCKKCNRVRGDTSYPSWLKHSYYFKVSKALPFKIQEGNVDLAGTLDSIKRLQNKRSR
jgi:HNH endonuclease